MSTLSITSNSNSTKQSNKNRRSKKYKYNLATQTATRLSTATTVTSSHQASVATNLRKNSRGEKGGRKSVSMYASTNEDTYSTPLLRDHRQKWMRNVLERLLVTNDNHVVQNHHSSLPSPLGGDIPATSSSSSSSPVDVLHNGFIQTELSPLSAVVNEARLSMKRISSSYDSPAVVVKEKPQLVDVLDFEVIKNRFYSDIVQKIKEISEKYLKITDENSNVSSSTLFDLTPHSYFQSECEEIRYEHDSFDSIPFIDEDSTSIVSFHEVKIKEEIPENPFSLNDLTQNLTSEHFEKILITLMAKNQYAHLTWFKIAFVFEFVNKTVQHVLNNVSSNKKDELIFRLKEMGANFIHTKYCDWIYEQGGWISLVRKCLDYYNLKKIKIYF